MISASAEEVALDAVSAGVLALGCAFAVAAASLWDCVCGVMLMPSGGCPLLLSASVWTEGALFLILALPGSAAQTGLFQRAVLL